MIFISLFCSQGSFCCFAYTKLKVRDHPGALQENVSLELQRSAREAQKHD